MTQSHTDLTGLRKRGLIHPAHNEGMVNAISFALMTLWLVVLALGVSVLVRRRWLLGLALVIEGVLAVAAQAALSLIPVGIGSPMIRIAQRDFFIWSLIALVVTLLILVFVLGRKRAEVSATRPTPRSYLAAALLTPVLAVGSLYGLSVLSTPERERERDPLRRNIQLESGFHVEIYLQASAENGLDNPTTMTFGPDGKLYVADIAGNLWVGSDTNNDHKIDTLSKFADGFSLLLGLAWQGNELYVSSAGKVEALKDTNGDGKVDTRRTLVDGLPSMILAPHSNNSLTFGPDGRLYFGVGNTTITGPEKHPLGGTIVSVSPDGGDAKIFASGFDNPFEIAFNSAGDMFSGDASSRTTPDGEPAPDGFTQVKAGGDYGALNGGINPGDKQLPLIGLAPHSTPTGLTIYNGKTYPEDYFDNAFSALWQKGDVLRLKLIKDPQGNYQAIDSVFGSGFLYPIDVVNGPDGNLYIADFGTSVVYRIVYDGK